LTEDRVLSRDELLRRYGRPRGERLVFTNGVFDLLHAGHLASLEAARALGERLVVGVNSDASTRRVKGPARPYQPEADRARLVAGLRCVDAVTLFDEDTPEALIEALLPDVLVKGADYEGREVAGADAVRAAGGEVQLVEMADGRSTTEIAARIRESR
jgi:D-beta-D-heptose 7-phosphate kinase/D-beta-D-heptose 1-phosphate adenosyltransferase